MPASKFGERVAERLRVLEMTAADAAARANLKRTYVQDLLAGKKQNVSGSALIALADVLNCSPRFLISGQRHDGEDRDQYHGKVVVIGVCQTGTWRDDRVHLPMPETVTATVPDYTQGECVAFLVNGPGAEDIGIVPQSIVVGVRPQQMRGRSSAIEQGDVIVIRRKREQGAQSEISIRKVVKTEDSALLTIPSRFFSGIKSLAIPRNSGLLRTPFRGTIKTDTPEQIEVLALVLRCIILIAPQET